MQEGWKNAAGIWDKNLVGVISSCSDYFLFSTSYGYGHGHGVWGIEQFEQITDKVVLQPFKVQRVPKKSLLLSLLEICGRASSQWETRGCAKRGANQRKKHSFFLVAEVSHCIGCSTMNLKNNWKQTFLWQSVVKWGILQMISRLFVFVLISTMYLWLSHLCHCDADVQIWGEPLSKRKSGSDRYSDEHKYTKNPWGFVLLWSSNNNGHWSVYIIYTVNAKL